MLTVIICVVLPVLYVYRLLKTQHPRDSKVVMSVVLIVISLFGFVCGICVGLVVGAVMPHSTITEQATIIQIDAPECRTYLLATVDGRYIVNIPLHESASTKVTVSDDLDDTIVVVTRTEGANRNSFLSKFALALPDYDQVLSTELEVPLHPSFSK